MAEKRLSKGEKALVANWTGNVRESSELAGIAYGTGRNYFGRPHVKEAIRALGERPLGEVTVVNPLPVTPLPSGTVMSRAQRQAWWSGIMDGSIEVPVMVNGKPLLDGKTNKVITESAGLKERIKVSELLGRSEGDFVDKVKQLGPGNSVTGIMAGRQRAGLKAGKKNK